MKVLVVDDEQLVRWFLERALNKWGHEVVSVANIREALGLIKKDGFDVMFTDLRMPEGNGTQLINQVCEITPKRPKIVVCSAFITSDIASDLSTKGILTLKKPFKLADLENTLKLCGQNNES